jgi:rSAM/selenodomain-associated transferase 1
MALAQLAVFVRPPVAGEVKTRLSGAFGDRGAAELYRAFARDTLQLCARVRAAGRVDLALWSAGAANETVAAWASQLEVPVRQQSQGDLGARLSGAFKEGLRTHDRVVVIGSDAPTLPIGLIGRAFQALEDASLVLGPANDGGYYAIGAARAARPSFVGVRWSTPHALQDTLDANREEPIAIIPPWYDIDDSADLHILRAHISVDPAVAPATAAQLRALVDDQR